MKMKKMLAIVLALTMAVSLAACGGSGASKMTMGTGGTSGTYYAFGGVLGQYIKNNAGIDVTVVSTDGSKANIESIDSGDYQLGTVQSDVMAYAWAGSRSFEANGKINSFRVVAGLYAEAVQLVTMNPDIKSVADLKGKSVSIGAPGSGSRAGNSSSEEIPSRVLTETAVGAWAKTASRNRSRVSGSASIPAPLPLAATVPEGQPRFRLTSS